MGICKRSESPTSYFSNKTSKKQHNKRNTSRMDSSTLVSSPLVTTSVTSSKEGKSFKYNEAGRRYHGHDDIAYVLPNDDDGK